MMGFMPTQQVIAPSAPSHGCQRESPCFSGSPAHPSLFLKLHIFTINLVKTASQNAHRFFSIKKICFCHTAISSNASVVTRLLKFIRSRAPKKRKITRSQSLVMNRSLCTEQEPSAPSPPRAIPVLPARARQSLTFHN